MTTRRFGFVLSAALLFWSAAACSGAERDASPPHCAEDDTSTIYRSTLEEGRTPSAIRWAGREWRVNAGATRRAGMDHSVRVSQSGKAVRFELRDTPADNSASDASSYKGRTRRSELSGSLYADPARLPNGEALWGAFSFRHQAWSDPEAMRELTGGVYGQIHIGSGFGGSPALAFRRTKDGMLRITTRGQFDRDGAVRYEAPLPFGRVHDVVYRVVLHPERGSFEIWLGGEKIASATDISIGHENAESYWNVGAYFSGGIRGRVVAEYANHIYPSRRDQAQRIASPPCWPAR